MTKTYKVIHYHDGTELVAESVEERPSSSITCLDGRQIQLRSVRYPSGLQGQIPESDIASISERTVDAWDGTR
jgi:hypothetical protein